MSTQDTIFKENFILKYGGKKLSLLSPKVMGIINVSPDSFYDGKKRNSLKGILKLADRMAEAGVSILDLGAVSTRPGSADPGVDEELRRLLPALKLLRATFPELFISVDTFKSEVALAAAECGADMINDVYAGRFDGQMMDVVGKLNIPYVMMHMKGTPADMQKRPVYKSVVKEVSSFFAERLKLAKQKKIRQLILDPGFGFGKTVEHNFLLLKEMEQFKKTGWPVLAGLSRKSMINRVAGTLPETALNGTTVVNTLALLNGASILRVHDVTEAVEATKIVTFYKSV